MNHSYRASALAKGLKTLQAGLLMLSLMSTSAGTLLAFPSQAEAATTSIIYPTANGTYTAWENAVTTVDETSNFKCNESDYVRDHDTSNEKESFVIDLSSVPNGSLITSVTVKTYSRDDLKDNNNGNGGHNGSFRTIARLNGVDHLSTGSPMSPSDDDDCEFDFDDINVTDTVKGAGTTLEIGVDKQNNSGKVRVGAIHATVTYTPGDTTAPTVTINQAVGQSDPTATSPILFTVQFSETVTDFDDAGDVTLSGTAGATTKTITPVDGDTYTVSVSGMTANGTVIANVPAGAAKDAANNLSTVATFTDNQVSFTGIDDVRPTVTINQALLQLDSTHISPINFTVEFSESVTGFSEGDVTIVSGAGAVIKNVTGSGSTYNVAVSGMTSSGTIVATIDSNKAVDGAGNGNLPSTSTDNSVTFTNFKPVAQNQNVDTDQDQSVTITLDASDDDNDPLTWEIVGSNPDDGVLSNLFFPNVTYTPNSGFYGDDSFQFRVFDGFEWSTAAKVEIEIDQADCPSGQHRNEAGNCVPKDPPQEEGQCTIVSNTEDFYAEGESYAVALVTPYLHEAWADNVSGASWIWGDPQVENPGADETQTFTKTFSITDVPSSATLEIAADNGAIVKINGTVVHDTITGLNDSQQNYNDPVDVETDIKDYLVAGENTIEIDVKNLAYPSNPTPEANPAGVIYKLVMEDVDCGEPVDTVTIVASKIVCTDESQLPNWGTGSAEGLERPITASTAANWVATHDTCSLKSGWKFQVGDQNAGDPGGSHVGETSGYTTFGPTDTEGVATAEFPLEAGVTELHLREVLKQGFIPFTFDQSNPNNDNNVSAEFYCSNDVLNYDNWDFIRNPEAGETYHCVAWNVPDPKQCDPESVIVLKSSDDDEGTLLTMVGSAAAEVVGKFIHESWVEAVGEWIWKDAGTSEEDAANGVTETFTRTFDVIGTPGGGTLQYAADNHVTILVNGKTLVTDTDEDNYSAMTTVAIPADMLIGGENELTFIVHNINHESLNTPTDNPAGLLYEVTIDDNECEPYVPEEEFATVTMCKAEFDEQYEVSPTLPGWTLMLKGAQVQNDLAIPVNSIVGTSSVALDEDLSYIAVASGIWRNAGQGQNFVDAEYSTVDGWVTPVDGFTGYSPNILELQIEEAFDPNAAWGPFSSTHEYARSFTVDSDGPANFRIFDGNGTSPEAGWYGDNVESNLAVDIFEGYAGVTGQNGCVTFTNVPYGTYTAAEIAQEGWSFHSLKDNGQPVVGLTVSVNAPSETFTVLNSENDGGGEDEFGTLIIEKIALGGDDTFSFTVNPEGEDSSFAMSVDTSEEESDSAQVEEGWYDVTEDGEEGWTFQSATCDYGEYSEGVDIVNGERVYVAEGETVTCTFTNTKDGEETSTSNTTIVGGNTSAGENLLGWMFNRDPRTKTPFAFNIGNASIGTGSLFVSPITNTYDLAFGNCKSSGDQADCDKFIGELFLLTPMEGFKSFTWDFKIGAPDSTVANQFYMNVYANFGTSSPTKFYDCRYDIVATTGSTAGFTTFTFDPTQSYPVTTRGGASASPYACPSIPAQMDTVDPSTNPSVIRVIALNVGDTSPSDTGVSAYLDKAVTVIKTGTNTHTETYDFEDTYEGNNDTSTPDGDDDDGNTGGRVRSSSNSGGQVLGASTECSPLLNQYLGKSYANPADEVMKLQTFLNDEVGAALPVTGIFGPTTEAAVHVFQKKYWEDVLKPWFEFPEVNIQDSDDSTGIVYKTTKWKINDIFCPGSEALPALP